MAKAVDDNLEVRKPGRPPIYPWETWTNGEQWEVTQGEDFQSSVRSFRVLLYVTARARDLRVTVRVARASNVVTFQFFPTLGVPA